MTKEEMLALLRECYEWLFESMADGPRVSEGALENNAYTLQFRDLHDRLKAALAGEKPPLLQQQGRLGEDLAVGHGSAASESPSCVRPSQQWAPIETAPRDGTKILLWNPRWSYAPIGKWVSGTGDDPDGWALDDDAYPTGCCEEGFIGWQEDIDDGQMPTYWMPEPPKEETK